MEKTAIVNKDTLNIECIFKKNISLLQVLQNDFPLDKYIYIDIPEHLNINNMDIIYENGIYNYSEKLDYAYEQMRNKRNDLLAKSDWTQFIDSPLSEDKKMEWKIYRQHLRDLPLNVVDIKNIVYPIPPL